MKKAAVLTFIVGMLVFGLPQAMFGQGRPRRVDPSRTTPPPAQNRPPAQQDAGADAEDDGEPLQLEGALIEVPVAVTDRTGRYVPQLRQQDFRVLEDGEPQQVVFFSTERVPIHVALVMDTSGSTRGTIGDIQEAAIEFINQLQSGDQVMLVSFSSEVIVEQEFTNDRGRLATAVRRTQPNGSTKLYEAVYLTVAERLRHVEGRKAMVILSDGEDTASREASADEAINVCSESDVVAYGIRYPETTAMTVYRDPSQRNPRPNANPWPNTNPGPNRSPWPNTNPGQYPPNRQPRRGNRGEPRNRQNWPGFPRIPGLPWPFLAPVVEPQFGGRNSGQIRVGGGLGKDPFMETITEQSGGVLYYADAVADVRGLFSTIAEELRQRYIIGYAPSKSLRSGGYRKISVQIPSRPDLAIRHRLGYQAETYK
jgi:Ca-activated chloride channel family protein